MSKGGFRRGMGFLSSGGSEDPATSGAPAVDPVVRFTEAAAALGLIRPGDKLDRNMVELCLQVVEMAAQVGDRHVIPGFLDDTVGDRIRAELLE
jgi:hypothetical protein